ncbi:MAG: energy transducer TonB, partial [Desulfosalsimonas sp.]
GKQQDTEDSGEEKPREISVKKGIKKKVSGDYDLKTPSPEKKSPENEETPDPDKVISDAVSRMEREAEKNKPDAVSDRIARLQGEVEGQDYKKRFRENSRQGSGGSGGRSHSGDLSPMEIYQAEVAALMKQNWAFSPDMAGENARGLEARLVIKIMSDGEISDVWFEKRSGNDYLDESAYRTVMKASPLPPLPEGRSRYHLLLGFTPSGLSN